MTVTTTTKVRIVRAVCPSYGDRSLCSYPACHERGGAVSAFCSVAADIALPAYEQGIEDAAREAEEYTEKRRQSLLAYSCAQSIRALKTT